VQRVFFPEVNHATVRVLSAEGCEVVVPEGQPCCGALPVHAGEEEPATSLARRTIDVFERAGVEVILTNAAGCGSHLKNYGHLLRDDPEYASRAATFSAKCRDVCEFLAGLEPRATRHPLPLRVAYQDACHLAHAQRVRGEPRSLLKTVPELSVLELPEASLCCGSAGIYNLVQPAPAQELGGRKADAVLQVSPDVVASGNPGCLLQMGAALRLKGRALPLRHTIEILDASLRNVSPIPGKGMTHGLRQPPRKMKET
jgi:glycolate oxidase iron-sulfur subunit